MVFSKSHEWADIDNGIATIGITEYAQSQLGDIVFIELPSPGQILKKGQQMGIVESTKAASEIYCPLNGEVVSVNQGLNDSPQLLNESPMAEGWIVKIKLADLREAEALMDEASYKTFIAQESR
jgi:glycine cleavage system H protein